MCDENLCEPAKDPKIETCNAGCVFPWKHGGKEYMSCIGSPGKYWCGTIYDYDSHYMKFASCDETLCPIQGN